MDRHRAIEWSKRINAWQMTKMKALLRAFKTMVEQMYKGAKLN